jgi:aldehyde:ferredoxin oxidoreductase
MCIFQTTYLNIELLGLPELAELYSSATGWKTTEEDFQRMAMQQLNLEKAFNLRFTDFDRKNDMPTPRDLYEPIPTGPLAGWKIDEEKWNRMLDDYYDLHGWDRETSYPKRETLADLGLDYVADELKKIGKLR